MTAKSIIEIPVNDAEFKDFITLFNQYRAQLAELPAAWNKVGKAVEGTAESAETLSQPIVETAATAEDIVASFAEMTAALMAQAEQHRKIAVQERTADAARRREREAETKAEKEKAKAAEKYKQNTDRANRTIKETRQNVAGIAGGIASAAADVLKWVGIGGIASGLIGGGGLFGLDRLANNAGDSRRSAQGLDTSIGDLKAFSVNYQRVVDPGSYLSNIETVARTPGMQYGVGADIARMSAEGQDTADVGAAMIPIIKQAFKQYGANAYGLKASGADQVVSLQEAIRISKLSDSEIGEIGGKYKNNKGALSIGDSTAKAWQDFDVQLDLAGKKIDTALIKGLEPLEPSLSKLSDQFADLTTTLLQNPHVKQWIDDLSDGLKHFTDYVGTDKFNDDVKHFVDDIGKMADEAKEAAYTFGLISRPGADPGATTFGGDTARAFGGGPRPDPKVDSNHTIFMWNATHPNEPQVPLGPGDPLGTTTPQERAGGYDPNNPNASQPFRAWLPDSYLHHLPGTAPWDHDKALGATETPGRPEDWRSLHNPGDIFVPGSGTQMLGFGSDDDGLRAIDKQLLLYAHRDHLDTIEDIIKEKYAPDDPQHKNNPEAYIRNLVARTGFARDQHLDFDDSGVAAKVIAGITKQEHNNTNYTPAIVKVIIENNTGSSPVISTSQFPS